MAKGAPIEYIKSPLRDFRQSYHESPQLLSSSRASLFISDQEGEMLYCTYVFCDKINFDNQAAVWECPYCGSEMLSNLVKDGCKKCGGGKIEGGFVMGLGDVSLWGWLMYGAVTVDASILPSLHGRRAEILFRSCGLPFDQHNYEKKLVLRLGKRLKCSMPILTSPDQSDPIRIEAHYECSITLVDHT